MSVPPGWVGACAPLLYIAQCSKKEIDTYVLASRVWIIPNALALISLIATFIRRCWLVKEGFNTVRLLLIKFMIGLPFHILFDVLRAFSPSSFGVSPTFTGFLWVTGWVGPISGMLLLTTTWMSFSSKNLLARPVVTGNWPLYLAFMVPFVATSLPLASVSGISHKVYLISMRSSMSSWSAMFLLLFACCFWFGRRTLNHLKATNDHFLRTQQLRAYALISGTLLFVGLCLGFNAFFLQQIDDRVAWFIAITSWYRFNSLFILVAASIYVWISTSHRLDPSLTSRSRSTNGTPRTDTDLQVSPRDLLSGSLHCMPTKENASIRESLEVMSIDGTVDDATSEEKSFDIVANSDEYRDPSTGSPVEEGDHEGEMRSYQSSDSDDSESPATGRQGSNSSNNEA